jgi:protein-S-isoprenylcysteine O-methyltransferase Ste14
MKQENKDNFLMSIVGIVFFLNMILLQFASPLLVELFYLGWIILGIGALFVVLSILTLRGKGTSNVTDSGVYGIVRHPMYLGGLIMFLSHFFFGQNWVIAVNTVVGIICCYLLVLSGDQRNLEKFGEEYKHYLERVPRINFIAGIVRNMREAKH